MLGYEVTNSAAPFFRQLGRVRGGEHGGPRFLRQEPGREQDRAIGAFRGAGRHEHREAVDLSSCNPLEIADQQPVMQRRLKPAMARPLS